MKLTNEYILAVKSGSLGRKVKRDFPSDYEKITQITRVKEFKEKLYVYLNPEAVINCAKCGKITKCERFSRGFPAFCSAKCRGRVKSKKPPETKILKAEDVSYWPTADTIYSAVKNANYSKSNIKKEFNDFYWYVESQINGRSFNEKLYLYIHKLKESCIVCKDPVNFDASTFSYKKFCSRKCANKHNGIHAVYGYNKNYFNRHNHKKRTKANIYLIRLYNDNENFLKVGITIRSMLERKRDICGLKYKMEVLKFKQMTLYECHQLEQYILNSGFQKYMPLIPISGRTECFLTEEEKNIWNLI